MKAIRRVRNLALISSMFLFLAACSGGGDDDNGNGGTETPFGPEGEISMITPYVNNSDIDNISGVFVAAQNRAAFVMSAHSGLDFQPSGNLKPFQAVCSGEIKTVNLVQLESTSNWQVEVEIAYNSTYSAYYAFEPMTALRADGETQLANISVSQGQAVSQGDIIGNLYSAGEGNHVHFGLFKYDSDGGDPVTCPEPYFTPEARESILNLIHSDHPDWNMCH